MKALMKISFLLLGVTVICWGVYFYSGNRIITRKVLAHYQNDSLKLAAATLLLDNIGDKFAYCKEDIERYDTIFALYDELNKKEKPHQNQNWQKMLAYLNSDLWENETFTI